MKTTVKTRKNNNENNLKVCCDVSKDTINVYCEVQYSGSKTIELTDEIGNNSNEIVRMLERLDEERKKYGFDKLDVICESTANYHVSLLSLARLLGHGAFFVLGQAVHRFSSIETNDTGKSDHKDPMVINSLVKLGKCFAYRPLDDIYILLKHLNEAYEQEDKMLVQVKNQIHAELLNLFCDWPLNMSYLYNSLGKGIQEIYQFNPYKIFDQGLDKLFAIVKKYAPKTRKDTIIKIWDGVKSSVKIPLSDNIIAMYEKRLTTLLDRAEMLIKSKSELRVEILDLYHKTEEFSRLESFVVLNEFAQARLIAETGPLKDFKHHAQLWRYTGLNLRERESGQWRGETKITKRGCSLFRKVIYFSVRGQVTHKGAYFYDRHKKKKAELGSGNKSLVSIMRFVVKAMFGVYKSKSEFSIERLFSQESNHSNKAA